MFKSLVIGNLGADAQIKESQGSKFVTFRVAHTSTYTDQQGQKRETTIWVDCVMSNAESKVVPYLKRGTKVFVMGNSDLRVYSSAKERRMMAGVSINVQSVELLGGSSDIVPRQLYDENGVVYNVDKYYHVNAPVSILYGLSGQAFIVGDGGWVSPNQDTKQEESNEPF